jgi:hypothetical protein
MLLPAQIAIAARKIRARYPPFLDSEETLAGYVNCSHQNQLSRRIGWVLV